MEGCRAFVLIPGRNRVGLDFEGVRKRVNDTDGYGVWGVLTSSTEDVSDGEVLPNPKSENGNPKESLAVCSLCHHSILDACLGLYEG